MNFNQEPRFPDHLPEGWKGYLTAEKEKPYFKSLVRFLKDEYSAKKMIYPQRSNIFKALQAVDYTKVKVVILGQDPYHGKDQAIGLSFAVPNELFPKPPSLQNIFKELADDLSIKVPEGKSDLSGWAEQGVLLLNAVLTVRAAQAFSHRDKGWENFTDRIIEILNERTDPVIFILWGSAAQKKKTLITNKQHFIIESAHPSPLSAYRGFFGSKPFSKVNQILTKLGKTPIDWAK